MKIIGYQSKGNAIRFYLGADDITPKYEPNKDFFESHQAPGLYPYIEFITGWKDVYVALEKTAFTNLNVKLEDFKSYNEPLVVITDSELADCEYGFTKFKGGRDVQRFYLDDGLDPDQIGTPPNYPGKSLTN